MVACRLSLNARQLDEKALRKVFDQISRDVPVGKAQHEDDQALVAVARPFEPRLKAMTGRHPQLLKAFGKFSKWVNQLGTLGGGNHFIEVCVDEADQVWVMLHSGSRGIGNALASYFIELARNDMTRQQVQLPDRDLAYFREGSAHFEDYVGAVHWAQEYAYANRECMMDLVLAGLKRHLPAFAVTGEVVNCHHNYVAREHHYGADVWVTRKGAIRAGAGDLGIVPGSMGARSYVVRGKGNAESFDSSAHGAGRRMSRNAAARAFTEADLRRQTEGVVCRKDKGVIDEIPGAYKDIDAVMANQHDLTEILHTLKQVVCVKG
ncbi:RtcB family protein [uncultured Dechloromonas sp.]|uniref:RtcB family protein n=1 Tax=uncultured Dechloromonas sp. TaxID=171719 RepID=UPI0025CDE305|nr:RtcB family protein [uncultured Dechloromonas sp.]